MRCGAFFLLLHPPCGSDIFFHEDEPLNELRTNLEVNDDALLIAALDAVPVVSQAPSFLFLRRDYCLDCVSCANHRLD